MKFIDDFVIKQWIMVTEDGIDYRTDYSGENWERRYGESWETVHSNEEQRCRTAWIDYFDKKVL